MSYFIPFFQEEELIDPNPFGQASLEMVFQDKHLVKCLTFAKRHLRKAINICQKDIAAGIFCLLTESDTCFALWREEPSESQEAAVEATPTSQSQPNKSQLSDPKEKESSSQIAGFDLIYESSPSATDEHHLAIAFQALETTVEPIDTTPYSEALPHNLALTAATPKTSKSKIKLLDSDIYSTPRSAFLALINQELAQHIGPMADYLVNKLLAEQPNIQPQKMIEAIAAEIPDPKQSQTIQKSLDRLTHEVITMV